jgi:hypothetical protein
MHGGIKEPYLIPGITCTTPCTGYRCGELKHMATKLITKLAFAICCTGVLLHLYTAMFRAEVGASVFLVDLMLLSFSPGAGAECAEKL